MNEKIKVLGVSINHYTAKEAMKKVMEYMETEPINVIEMVTRFAVPDVGRYKLIA